MHMADALISPAVGGTLWIVSGGLIVFCARKVKQSLRDNLVPLMGVLGAFIFTAQMINFSIPGTGSSGHLGGGLMLTLLLGPYAAFLVIASVLTIQAFFFADGGLLALGCNLFNLGFFPAFVAYPLLYRTLTGNQRGTTRIWIATLAAAVVGLELGAFSVALETRLSGISELPFLAFVIALLPIHLAIGLVEGLATFVTVSFIARARPEVLYATPSQATVRNVRPVVIGLAIVAAILGGAGSWFASTHPDGLEWAITQIAGKEERSKTDETIIRKGWISVQEKTALLPDYDFKNTETKTPGKEVWPAVNAGTSVSGIVGGLCTLALAGLIGFVLAKRSRQP